LAPTFANGREEESFSRSNGIANGSKRGVEEKADCRILRYKQFMLNTMQVNINLEQ
jgi:hypothetical protein